MDVNRSNALKFSGASPAEDAHVLFITLVISIISKSGNQDTSSLRRAHIFLNELLFNLTENIHGVWQTLLCFVIRPNTSVCNVLRSFRSSLEIY